MNHSTLPFALTSLAQWCTWDPDTKKPSPSVDRPSLTYLDAVQRDADHVGFVFTLEDPYAGIDIDDMTPLAQEILSWARQAGAYVERSPSGRGWHIIGRGKVARGIRKGSADAGVEAYSFGRYFTVTGEGQGDPDVSVQPLLDRLAALRSQRMGFNGPRSGGPAGGGGERWDEDVHAPLLAAIDPDDYGTWIETGMALRAGGAPLDVWVDWSRGSPKFPGVAECAAKWASFRGHGVGLGSLHVAARESGWDEGAAAVAAMPDLPPLPEPEQRQGNVWAEATVWGASLTGTPPERVWAWEPWIPQGVVTGLCGPPGVAKSTLALQLCVHHCLGLPFLGGHLGPGPAMFITVEDDLQELHRRLHRICRSLFIHPSEVEGLALIPAVDMLTSLLEVDAQGRLRVTRKFRDLILHVKATGTRLLVLDLVGDFWAGNENIRAEVTEYVRHHLGRMAARLGVGLVAISHLNKAGEVSGSTAWLGSYRSALSLTRSEEGEGRLELLRMKANYTAPQERPEVLRWTDGYVLPVPADELDEEQRAADGMRVAQLPEGQWLGIEVVREIWEVSRKEARRILVRTDLDHRLHGGAQQWRRNFTVS